MTSSTGVEGLLFWDMTKKQGIPFSWPCEPEDVCVTAIVWTTCAMDGLESVCIGTLTGLVVLFQQTRGGVRALHFASVFDSEKKTSPLWNRAGPLWMDARR